MLFKYMEAVQRFLRDSKQDLLDPQDIVDHINTARREVAMRAQCIRRLTPISGAVISATVTAEGSGYTDPTVTISAPDFPSGFLPFPQGDQATANAIVIGGSISAVDIQYGGSGYWQPTLTIEDPTGTGAAATASVSFVNQVNEGQESYPFADVDVSMWPGVKSIYYVISASIMFSNYRYSIAIYSFSTYQARVRQFPSFQYQYVPCFGSQYGQGTDGSFFLYPVPSQPYQIEFDALCLPSDLIGDDDYEAIPEPWQDAVKYFASHLCFLDIQSHNNARLYLELFDQFMHRYGAYARPGRMVNPYGRW